MHPRSDCIPLALRPNPGPGHRPLPSGLLVSSCLCSPIVNSPHWFKSSDGGSHFSAANLCMVSISMRVEAAVSRVPCWPLVICPRGVSGLLSLYSPLSHPPAALASWLTLNTPGPALPGPGPMHSFLFLSHSPRCMVHTSPLSLCTHAAFSVGGCLSPPPPPPA